MNSIKSMPRRFLMVAILVGTGTGCEAKSDLQTHRVLSATQQASQPAAPAQSESIHVRALGPDEAPDETALRELVGKLTTGASVQLRNYQELLIVDRILVGLEAAGRVMTIGDGQTITWGFKYQEANLQSVVIADKTGRLELVAVVDDILRLSHGKTGTVASVTEYQKKAKGYGLEPHVVVFARDSSSLEIAYPLLQRWMQANLLGFNTSCAPHAAACALMSDLDLHTDAYVSSGAEAAPIKVTLPAVPVASVPLEKFTQ